MDSAPENGQNEIEKLSRKIPALSDYAASLESHVKLRYLRRVSLAISLVLNVCRPSNSPIYSAT